MVVSERSIVVGGGRTAGRGPRERGEEKVRGWY